MGSINLDKLVLGGIGVAVLGYLVSTFNKMEKVCNNLNTSLDDLSKKSATDISEAVVNAAAERAVNHEAHKVVEGAVRKIMETEKDEIRKAVKKQTSSIYDSMRNDIKEEVKDQIGDIDITDLRREVVEEAKEAAANKLDGNLETILDKFNSDLDNVSKIYRSIAGSFGGGSDKKDVVFKLG